MHKVSVATVEAIRVGSKRRIELDEAKIPVQDFEIKRDPFAATSFV